MGTIPLPLQRGPRTGTGKCSQLERAALVRHTAALGTDSGLRSCFPRKFSLDDLLTNIMIYWTTGTITSSQRFYKENMGKNFTAEKPFR